MRNCQGHIFQKNPLQFLRSYFEVFQKCLQLQWFCSKLVQSAIRCGPNNTQCPECPCNVSPFLFSTSYVSHLKMCKFLSESCTLRNTIRQVGTPSQHRCFSLFSPVAFSRWNICHHKSTSFRLEFVFNCSSHSLASVKFWGDLLISIYLN